jgi:hypothetical protein
MADPIIIAKRTTLSGGGALVLDYLSVTDGQIPANPATVTLSTWNTTAEIQNDSQLIGYIDAGLVILNVDGVDLTQTESTNFATTVATASTPTLDVSVTPLASYIPQADTSGFLDPGWTSIAQVVSVALSGSADFTSIKAACDSITDASATKPYEVRVGPGVYTEAPFTVPSYVHLEGSGFISTIVQTSNNAAHFITGSAGAFIKNLAILGPSGTGFSCIYHTEESYVPLIIENVVLKGGYYGIWANQAASRGIVHCFGVGNWYAAGMNTFMRSTGYGNITAMWSAFMSGPPAAVTTGYYCSGANAEMTLDLCAHRNSGSTDAVFADDGAYVRLNACTFSKSTNGIHVGSTGTGTTVRAAGCVIREGQFTKDIWIESASAVVSFSGSADKAKITETAGNSFSASFSDITSGEEGQVILGELWAGTGTESTPLATLARKTAPTGYVTGGTVTRGTGLAVDVALGTGFVNTGTGVIYVEWAAATGISVAASSDFWVYVTSAGVVSVATSEPSEEANIILAAGRTNGTSIPVLSTYTISVDQLPERLHEFVTATMGTVWISGGVVTKNAGTSVQIDVSASAFYVGIDVVSTVASATPAAFTYWYRDGSGGWSHQSSQTSISTANYDDGTGTLAAIPASEWKKDLVFVTSGGDGTEIHVVYAQETFTSQALAEAGSLPVPPAVLAAHALRTYGVVVQVSATDITSLVDHRPRFGTAGSGTTTTSDHSLLSNLGSDDHSQYALLSGGAARNPVTGTLDFSGGSLLLPTALTPTQTAEGSVVWDSDGDQLTVGDGASRKVLMAQGDSAGGDVGGTFPTSLTVTDLTIASESQGDLLYFNGTNWVRLGAGTSGQHLQTQGAGANPVWATVSVGDVVGPASATDNAVVLYDGTTGKLIKSQAVWTYDGTWLTSSGLDDTGIQFLNDGVIRWDNATAGRDSQLKSYDNQWLIEIRPDVTDITVGTVLLTGSVGVGTAPSANVRLHADGGTSSTPQATTVGATTNYNDFASGQYSNLIFRGASSAFTVTGIANPVDGKVVRVVNASGQTLTLAHDSASSSAVNRIWLPGATDLAIPDDSGITLIYNGTDGRWGQVGSAGVPPTFGAHYQKAESLGESTTTSSSFQRKLRLTTPTLPAGDYHIQWSCGAYSDDRNLALRVQVDDSTTLFQSDDFERVDNDFFPLSGHADVTLSAASHTVDLDYAQGTSAESGSARIKYARITIWRVA